MHRSNNRLIEESKFTGWSTVTDNENNNYMAFCLNKTNIIPPWILKNPTRMTIRRLEVKKKNQDKINLRETIAELGFKHWSGTRERKQGNVWIQTVEFYNTSAVSPKKCCMWARERAQWVNCLSHKREELSSDFQQLSKRQMWSHAAVIPTHKGCNSCKCILAVTNSFLIVVKTRKQGNCA